MWELAEMVSPIVSYKLLLNILRLIERKLMLPILSKKDYMGKWITNWLPILKHKFGFNNFSVRDSVSKIQDISVTGQHQGRIYFGIWFAQVYSC